MQHEHKKVKRENNLQPLLMLIGLMFLFFLFLTSYVYRNIEMSRVKYDINRLKKKRMQLYLEVENLRLSTAQESTVYRIDTLFRERYGNVSVDLGANITSIELPEIVEAAPLDSPQNELKKNSTKNPAKNLQNRNQRINTREQNK